MTDMASSGAGPERWSWTTVRLARRAGLKLVTPQDLSWTRRPHGDAFRYYGANGRVLPALRRKRLASLAVPPAYKDVRYASDPSAHLQAIGTDAAGRLQYRYHPQWETVREARKARRLLKMVEALPVIRKAIRKILKGNAPTREFALASVIELVARTAIRPGNETYARVNGTRGATTLLKSNVAIEGDCIVLSFRAKGGRQVTKECDVRHLVHAVKVMRKLPGKRLFQYRDDDGTIRSVSAAMVNQFLRQLSDTKLSLKDFRTLMASAAVVESLARVSPAASARARRKQVLEAVRSIAEELANTPAICQRSYVHETVVTAFEKGMLEKFSKTLKGCRGLEAREAVLARVVKAAAAQ